MIFCPGQLLWICVTSLKQADIRVAAKYLYIQNDIRITYKYKQYTFILVLAMDTYFDVI